ncbi:MAG TPA: IPT/TIG domain-containing protein [Bryobacteraceae bacterium]|nr:IPT/TIG domain-containing protein [Bryobacteraceae bacterium]
MKTRLSRALFLIGAAASFATAQTASWDTSGNGMLSGTYYFRHVIWIVGDNSGNLGDAASLYGTIAFTPATGTYTINAQLFWNGGTSTTPTNFTANGTYSISASGYGFMSNALANNVVAADFGVSGLTEMVFGLVSRQGIFVGSSTENQYGYNDLFIAAPVGTTQATAATLNGNYSMMELGNPQGEGLYALDALFTFNSNGAGSLTSLNGSGYIGLNGASAVTQNIGNMKYTFQNGAGSIPFSSTGTLIAGTHYIYISPDGNFIFGGSPQDWDMFVGVRTGSGTPNFNGLYYQAGLDLDLSDLVDGNTTPDSYYGSLKTLSGGNMLGHQRILSVFNSGSYDFTYNDSFSFNTNGTSDDSYFAQHYVYSSDGAIRIGIGQDPYLGINVGLQAPSFTPSGVFLDPTGITNSASTALFTTSLAPGELVTIYGSGLSGVSDFTTPGFPTIMDGVQVKVNGIFAPIQLVSSGFITFMVPYEVTGDVVSIQVINKNTPSNTITAFLGLTAPGVFTIPAGGIGDAYARKTADFSVINSANPANVGDTIFVGLTGLGAVNPSIPDGAPGPSTTFSQATNEIDVFFNDAAGGYTQATTTFVGLTPTIIGLYQMNFPVPTGVASGPAYLEISGPDSYNSEATMQIGSSGSVSAARSVRPHTRRPPLRNKMTGKGALRKFPTTHAKPLTHTLE